MIGKILRLNGIFGTYPHAAQITSWVFLYRKDAQLILSSESKRGPANYRERGRNAFKGINTLLIQTVASSFLGSVRRSINDTAIGRIHHQRKTFINRRVGCPEPVGVILGSIPAIHATSVQVGPIEGVLGR